MKAFLRPLLPGLALCAAAVFAVPADSLRLDSPVVDQAGVIADETEIALNAQLRQWHAQGLMQGAVVLVDSTDGMDDFDYAMQVGKRWQLGDKTRDDGLLLLIAVNDRKIRFITGSGIEGALPDISAKKIIREDITPYFRNGDYAGGVRAGLEAAARRLQADPAVQAEMVAQDGEVAPDSLFAMQERMPLLIFLLFALSLVTRIARRHRAANIIAGLVASGTMWLMAFPLMACLMVLLFFWMGALHGNTRENARATRQRRKRDDDDDHWFGGFGGGFGGGGFGGGGFGGGFGGGGYGGGGGSFSGGGAGGSW